MKLVNDFRVRASKWLYLMIIPLVVYFIIYKQHIYDLTVGGIIFMYWTLFVMFINRYIKVWLQHKLAIGLEFEPEVMYKTLKPQVIPRKRLTAIDVQKLEGYAVLMVMSINFLAVTASYALTKDAYLTKVLLGGFILSFNIHYSNICRIVKSVEYPNAYYEYNDISMKIYDTPITKEAIS